MLVVDSLDSPVLSEICIGLQDFRLSDFINIELHPVLRVVLGFRVQIGVLVAHEPLIEPADRVATDIVGEEHGMNVLYFRFQSGFLGVFGELLVSFLFERVEL